MKMKFVATLLSMVMAAGLLVVGVGAQPAEAAKPADDGIACLKAGQEVLRSLDLFSAAARGEIDYSTLADSEEGPIFADLPEGSFLPINTVFALHKSNPELFAWCG